MSPAASLCLNLKLLRPTYFLLLPLNALRMKSLGLVIRIKEVILRKKLELEEISRKMHMATQVLKSENFSVEAIETGVKDPKQLLEQIDSEIAKVKEEDS
ncbi:hypothetical protein ISN44_As06g035600 [Arabidopsis suecica]|uniref:Uncharacterized protein n=1 Tax=Arabidopsis suecica TaxID=45249 RepID=A0A8T2CG80_ARASU|nr:hypothetical protein ISN44_As06g035600 [Arabidopsis suecica]